MPPRIVKNKIFPPLALLIKFFTESTLTPTHFRVRQKMRILIMANSKSSGRGPSSHPGPGGNWPSQTGNPSGGDRGNAPPKSK
jgi:hypothetical protein